MVEFGPIGFLTMPSEESWSSQDSPGHNESSQMSGTGGVYVRTWGGYPSNIKFPTMADAKIT